VRAVVVVGEGGEGGEGGGGGGQDGRDWLVVEMLEQCG